MKEKMKEMDSLLGEALKKYDFKSTRGIPVVAQWKGIRGCQFSPWPRSVG